MHEAEHAVVEEEEWHHEERHGETDDGGERSADHPEDRERADHEVLEPVERDQRRGAPAEGEHRDHGQQVHPETDPGERIAIGARDLRRVEEAGLHSASLPVISGIRALTGT